jgi:hypothetical protein
MGYRELSEAQVEQFVSTGVVVVKGAIERGLCARWVATAFEQHGFDPADASTWTTPYARNAGGETAVAREVAPRAWAAMEDLLGGPERVEQGPGAGGGATWSNSLAGNF